MNATDEKLKIALEALLKLKYQAIAANALREIQRDHYLGSPSPVVHQVLAGVKL